MAGRHRIRDSRGYSMAALLVMLAIISVVVSVALPVWRTVTQREKEEELIFRGQQYARAISLFQRRFANAYPPSIDVLVEQKYLRKKYKDPMTADGEFQVLYQGSALAMPGGRAGQGSTVPGAGTSNMNTGGRVVGGVTSSTGSGLTITVGRGAGPQGGIIGVASKSTEKSIRLYEGHSKYNEWQFIWLPGAMGGRGGAAGVPGGRGGRGPGGGTAFPGAGIGSGSGPGRGGGLGPGGPGSGQGPGNTVDPFGTGRQGGGRGF